MSNLNLLMHLAPYLGEIWVTNREIAEELYLATNTVKWYGSQIYGKLGVRKRAEAVDRAHELGIL